MCAAIALLAAIVGGGPGGLSQLLSSRYPEGNEAGRYLLSAILQSQAALLAMLITVRFLLAQLGAYSVPPEYLRRPRSRDWAILLFGVVTLVLPMFALLLERYEWSGICAVLFALYAVATVYYVLNAGLGITGFLESVFRHRGDDYVYGDYGADLQGLATQALARRDRRVFVASAYLVVSVGMNSGPPPNLMTYLEDLGQCALEYGPGFGWYCDVLRALASPFTWIGSVLNYAFGQRLEEPPTFLPRRRSEEHEAGYGRNRFFNPGDAAVVHEALMRLVPESRAWTQSQQLLVADLLFNLCCDYSLALARPEPLPGGFGNVAQWERRFRALLAQCDPGAVLSAVKEMNRRYDRFFRNKPASSLRHAAQRSVLDYLQNESAQSVTFAPLDFGLPEV